MIDNYIISPQSTVFMVTAMKMAKDAHQDTLRLNEIPKCVPPGTQFHTNLLRQTQQN